MRAMPIVPCCLLAAAGLALAISPAAAQEPAGGAPFRGVVFFGAAAVPEYDGARQFRAIPFIAGRIESSYRYLAVEGFSARANLLNREGFELGPVAALSFGRDRGVDNAAIARLSEVDPAVGLGGFMAVSRHGSGREGAGLRLAVQAVHRFAEGQRGWEGTISAGYVMPVGMRGRVNIDLSVTALDDAWARTFFSVTPAGSAASGLPVYGAKGGVKNFGGSVTGAWALSRRWLLGGFGGYQRLLGSAADSPIVDMRDQLSAGLGIGLAF